MGTVSRHSGAPFADGETLSGTDLETDIGNIVDEVNGNLTTSNLSSAAGIVGGQIAAATITNAKMVASTLTTASQSLASVVYTYVDTTTNQTLDSSGSWAAVPDLSIAVTNLTIGDQLLLQFNGLLRHSSSSNLFEMTFGIDGTEETAITRFALSNTPGTIVPMNWTYTATATSHTVTVMSKGSTTFTTLNLTGNGVAVFQVTSIPQK